MIRAKSIDAVVIASPPSVQEKMVYYALKRNKHIFCEKPITNSLFKAEKLEKILKKKNKIANIVNYFFPEMFSPFQKKKHFQQPNLQKTEIHVLSFFGIFSGRGFRSDFRHFLLFFYGF